MTPSRDCRRTSSSVPLGPALPRHCPSPQSLLPRGRVINVRWPKGAVRGVVPVLIQILLPRTGHAEARDADFAQTRSGLVERYDRVTAYLRSPAQGAWTAADGRGLLKDIGKRLFGKGSIK
jgi:hypothetical protein